MKLFHVPISSVSKEEAVATIAQWVIERGEARSTRSRAKIITTPNPEMIVAAQKDPEFLEALQSADLAIADGWGVVAAVRLLSKIPNTEYRIPNGKRNGDSSYSEFSIQNSVFQRISGLSLMEDLIMLAAQEGWRVMLLGGKPGIAEKAAGILKATSEKLRIVGLAGPRDIQGTKKEDMNQLMISINKHKPDLLFVAFGHGKQEKWMAKYRERLDVGVMMGVGGSLDQIVDPTLRPPGIIDSIGLGWLYRLVREPRRWRRQLALVEFGWMVFVELVKP